MSGFDKTYNDQCAAIWNPDPSLPIEYEVQKWWYTQKWDVIARKGGLGICQETYDNEADAVAHCNKLKDKQRREEIATLNLWNT
jgi:hypothetical protein